jgi:antitoxin HigA-1
MPRTPIHPGEILADELDAIGLSAAGLARLVDVPANRISQIVAGRRNVTADTALRLGRCFGTSADFWMNLQKTYELDLARAEIGPALERIPQRTASEPVPDTRHP